VHLEIPAVEASPRGHTHSHLQPASKMSPERPTESSPLDDFASEIAPN
jgi:hypothetical protein